MRLRLRNEDTFTPPGHNFKRVPSKFVTIVTLKVSSGEMYAYAEGELLKHSFIHTCCYVFLQLPKFVLSLFVQRKVCKC